MNTCAWILSAVGPSSTIRSFFVGGPSGKSVPLYRVQPLGAWTLNVPSAETAGADHCRSRRTATTPRTTATAAIAPRRHLAAPADVIRPMVTAGAGAPGWAGWGVTDAAGRFTVDGSGVARGAPHRGQTVAPLQSQVQHLRQTARLIWPTSRSSPCASASGAAARGRRPADRGPGYACSSCQRHRFLPRGVVDLGTEAISDAALGLDVDRLAGVRLDLAAQPRDVHSQPFLVGFLVARPGLGQECLVGDHPSRVPHEEEEQLGLGRRQRHLLPLDPRPVLHEVDLELLVDDDFGLLDPG